MFLVNSRLGLVTATSSQLPARGGHQHGHPFSRSYGVNLPSSLTRVLSIALVFSTYLPVSVCGTGTSRSSLRGFSWQFGLNDSSHPYDDLGPALPSWQRGFPTAAPATSGHEPYPLARSIYPPASPHRSSAGGNGI